MLHVYGTFAHCSFPAGKKGFHCELKRPGKASTMIAVVCNEASAHSGSVFLVRTPVLLPALAPPCVVLTIMQYACS